MNLPQGPPKQSKALPSASHRAADTPDNIVGNHEAKYESRNPIARRLVAGFLKAVTAAVDRSGARRIYEVGCGECALAYRVMRRVAQPIELYTATDIDISRARAGEHEDPAHSSSLELKQASVYALPLADHSQDLVLCCEVLEHLTDPAAALRELARVTRGHVIISTPREPLWRTLNLARGKYVTQLGNTPGHIQHFSRRELLAAVQTHFEIEWVQTPLPWTVVLARARPQLTMRQS